MLRNIFGFSDTKKKYIKMRHLLHCLLLPDVNVGKKIMIKKQIKSMKTSLMGSAPSTRSEDLVDWPVISF